MAIYHLSAQVINSAQGRSAVRAAAYRHGAKMMSAALGEEVSYSNRDCVAHSELSLPTRTPEWFRTAIDGRDAVGASEILWNAIEKKEGFKGTTLAMEMNIALPVELAETQNIELARAWIEEHVTSKGFVADWAVHNNEGNPHFHVMIPMRRLNEKGFGAKHEILRDMDGNAIRREDGKARYQRMSPPQYELASWRQSWADVANRHLAQAGLDVRIDHRSFREQGVSLEPTGHLGATACNMVSRGKEADRFAQEAEKKRVNAAKLIADPTEILRMISREKSVFSRHEVAKSVFRYVDDDATFQKIFTEAMASTALVCIQPEVLNASKREIIQEARYTTMEMLQAEQSLLQSAAKLWVDESHGVKAAHVEKAFDRLSFLAEEQREAVRLITGKDRIASVVGFAGAGKSTMLDAANEAWRASGYNVFGAALAGKAAEGLEKSANISSRTLASWELAWGRDKDLLAKGDVFVIDEAGMVSSKQLSRVLEEVERRGAKAVLVGDAMQLQPIEAGAAFRAVYNICGYGELVGVRRQKQEWMREASVQFARGEVDKALGAYRDAGMVRFYGDRDQAKADLIQAWKPDFLSVKENGQSTETLILSHTNDDVYALNQLARAALKEEGRLANESAYMTARGERQFAVGDRLIFLENDRLLGVKNGMLASVLEASPGKLTVRLDQDGIADGRTLTIKAARYANVDHGYAATVHKSQGATVDKVHVLATPGMDMHLAYVAMSRHRDSSILHAAREDFIPRKQRIGLEDKMADPVLAAEIDAQAYASLVSRLSRDGSKEVTFDYLKDRAFRLAAGALAQSGSIETLQKLANKLDRVEARGELVRDQFRAADIREFAAAFAERRGLNPRVSFMELLREQARKVLDQAQKFWGFATRLDAVRENIHGKSEALAPEPLRSKEPNVVFETGLDTGVLNQPKGQQDVFRDAVERFVKSYRVIAELNQNGFAVPAAQREALNRAGKDMNVVQAGSKEALMSALNYDPEAKKVLRAHNGVKLIDALLSVMEKEAKALKDPKIRASRFISGFNILERRRQSLAKTASDPQIKERLESTSKQLRVFCSRFDKDAPAAAVVKTRLGELALAGFNPERSLAQNFVQQTAERAALEQSLQSRQEATSRPIEAKPGLDKGKQDFDKEAQAQAQTAPRLEESPPSSVRIDPSKPEILPPLIPAFVMTAAELALIEARAFGQAQSSEPVRKDFEAISDFAAKYFREPEPFVTAVAEALRLPREKFEKRVYEMFADVERFGGLRGEVGLFAGKAAKTERRGALEIAPILRASTIGLKTHFDKQCDYTKTRMLEAYDKMKIEIPGMSDKAFKALQMIAAGASEQQKQARTVIASDPALSTEVSKAASAVAKRFGTGAVVGKTMDKQMPFDAPISPQLRNVIKGAAIQARRKELGLDGERTLDLSQKKEQGLIL